MNIKRLTTDRDIWGDSIEEEALQVLKNGGILLYPTETCYGLGVDIFNEEALQKLYQLKKMPVFKPVSIIVTNTEDAQKWGEVTSETEDLMNRYWPGPYTFVVKKIGSLPGFFNKGNDKVGLRNPAAKSLLNVVAKLGHPISTTSANLTGKAETYMIDDYLSQIKGEYLPVQPDLMIDAGRIGENPPSNVYDCVDKVVIRGEIDV